MHEINPFQLISWTFRRNESDVINLYDSLSELMKIVTNGDFLNFGYWENSQISPIEAQKKLCTIFAKKSRLESGQTIVDVGSGFGSPARQWSDEYFPIQITCININPEQTKTSILFNKSQKWNTKQMNKESYGNIDFVNATSTAFPLKDNSYDRILSLESAHHFKPLSNFLSESSRILKPNGLLALAIPVLSENSVFSFAKLGLLSFTWSSEHYSLENVLYLLKKTDFKNIHYEKIGSNVYRPLVEYYVTNRQEIKNKILSKYPSYVEKLLYHSLKKMNDVSQKNIIDYLLVTCNK